MPSCSRILFIGRRVLLAFPAIFALTTTLPFSTHAAPVVQLSTDPCAKIKSGKSITGVGKWVDFDDTLACMKSIPFEETKRDALLDNISKMEPFYVFSDIITEYNESPYSYHKDMKSFVQETRKKKYETDFDFQIDVMEWFKGLDDSHTDYVSDCYTAFVFKQPFTLSAVTIPASESSPRKTSIIHMAHYGELMPFTISFLASLHKTVDGFNLHEYVGAEILEIDDIPALDAIVQYADQNVGLSKDRGTRFNMALAAYESGLNNDLATYQLRQGQFAQRYLPPKQRTMKWKILKKDANEPETIVLPWMVYNRNDFRDKDGFVTQHCLSKAFLDLMDKGNGHSAIEKRSDERAEGEFTAPDDPSDPHHPQNPHHFPPLPSSYDEDLWVSDNPYSAELLLNTLTMDHRIPAGDKGLSRLVAPSEIVEDKPFEIWAKPFLQKPYMSFFKVDDTTGVVALPTFKVAGRDTLFASFADGLIEFKKLGIQKLIIDLSNNAGGLVCLAYGFANYFFSHSTNRYFPTAAKAGSAPLKLFRAAAADESAVVKWRHDIYGIPLSPPLDQHSANSLLHPPRILQRGNTSPTHYTNYMTDSCTFRETQRDAPPFPIEVTDLVIVTNGFCGSSCALFLRHMQQVQGVKTVTVGGVGEPMGGSTFPGGEAFHMEGLRNTFHRLGLENDVDAPVLLPQRGSLAFTFRETYSHTKTDLPLEFDFLPSDGHIEITAQTAFRPDQIWKEVATRFLNGPSKER